MSELTEEQKKLLKRLADAEREARPFEYEHGGVNYKSIGAPAGWGPKIQGLATAGYLERSGESRSSTLAQYRLTREGWDELGENPP